MKKDYMKHIFALLLFGSNGIVAKNIALTSYEIVFWRTVIGSIFLITLFFISKKEITFTKNKKDLIFIALSGIAMGASWMFLYEAYVQIGVSIATLVYYCGPVIVMMLSPFLFKEKMTMEKVISFGIVMIGIFLVNGKTSGELNAWGIFCGGMSAVTYSLMVMFNKKSKTVKGLENSMIQLVVSFLTVAIFIGMKTGYHMHVNAEDWVWIIVLGLLNTGIGCYLYFSSIGELPVQTVAICGYLEPLSAVIFAVIILKERMLPIQIMGAVLIIGGAIFGECYKKVKV